MNIVDALQQSKQKQFYENKNKLKPCTHCGENNWVIRKAINKNDMECYPYFCIDCGFRSPICEKKSIALKILGE